MAKHHKRELPNPLTFIGPGKPELGIHEGLFTPVNGETMRMVASSHSALFTMAEQADSFSGALRPAEQGEVLDFGSVDDRVAQLVTEMVKTLEDRNALDIIAMLRQFLTVPDLSLRRESGSSIEDSWAPAEVIILLLLGIGLPEGSEEKVGTNATVIPGLVNQAAEVLALSSIRAIMRAGWSKTERSVAATATGMAARFAAFETSVRGRQYAQIADKINEALLESEAVKAILSNAAGFTYADVQLVTDAIAKCLGDAHHATLSNLNLIPSVFGPVGERQVSALRVWSQSPSSLFLVEPDVIAKTADLEGDTVSRVLAAFSIGPQTGDAHQLVRELYEGRNPMAGKGIVATGDGRYLSLPGALAPDEIRRTVEELVKASSLWSRYEKHRAKGTEALAATTLERLLGGRGTQHRGLKYRFTNEGEDLGPESGISARAPLAEVDCLVDVDGVLLCVEVKAGGLRAKSRQGGASQLLGDLQKTVRHASRQARRVSDLVEENSGLWLEDGTWMDLAHVSEVHSVVVCLDDLGPLSLMTAELMESEILDADALPWVVSLHDLLVVADVLDEPASFLSFLRRRTDPVLASGIAGSDELDLLMWYVSGGLFLDPLDEAEQQVAKTTIGTFTDPLDAFYYYEAGFSSVAAELPHREYLPPYLDALVNGLREVGAPGWLRLGADLHDFSSDALDETEDGIDQVLLGGDRDGGFHSWAVGGSSVFGDWVLVIGSSSDALADRDRLRTYTAMKKHQARADRAFAVFLDEQGRPVWVTPMLEPYEPNEVFDAQIAELLAVPDAGSST